MAKTMYHSHLAAMGQVLVTVTGEVTASKYRGQPPYVAMMVNGEAKNYSCENDQCAAALRGRRGQTLLIEATGREAEAAITLYAAPPGAAPQQPTTQPTAQQPPPPQAPPPQQYQQPPPAAAQPQPPQRQQAPARPAQSDPVAQVIQLNRFLRGHANAMVLAVKSVMAAVESAAKEMNVPFTDDMRRGIAANLIEDMAKGATATAMLIRAERSGILEGFPAGPVAPLLDEARKRSQPRQQPPPPPAPPVDPYDAQPDVPPDEVPM